MRIQKWLSQLGLASRREAEQWLLAGRISINGKKVNELGFQVDPESDRLTIDGRIIETAQPPLVYWMLHKPDQFLSSHKSADEKPTIYDLPRLKGLSFKINSVGRLDFRTEGLLLLSNDGDFIHKMTHPRYKLPRSYYALVSEHLSEEQLKKMRQGVELKDGMTEKVDVQLAQRTNLGKSKGSWYYLTVHEGRNRLVRRLFEHFDKKVVKLVRVGFGSLRLPDNLKPGEYRQLSSKEIHDLKSFARDAQNGKDSQ